MFSSNFISFKFSIIKKFIVNNKKIQKYTERKCSYKGTAKNYTIKYKTSNNHVRYYQKKD